LPIAVNLTRRQFFDDHLLPDLASILGGAGMEASLLELEVTENVLMQDIEKAGRVLTQLKTLGVRMAIDGFGSGYSSLIALERFPIDTIKIDRSLIKESTLAKGADLTDAIIAMSRTLSMTVVAQGVETKEQADFLRAHAYDEFQGFYFHKPIPVDQFTQLLRAQTDVAEEASAV
jgi:EAL domain-containing protein (putative c-di-GMP-specific phosphodiesterase class I)